MNAVNARTVSDNLAAPAVRAHFRNGDFASACAVVRGFQGGYTEVFWQQALIVCQVFAGKPEQAAFGLDLLRRAGHDRQSGFQRCGVERICRQCHRDRGTGLHPRRRDEMTFAIWLAAKAEIPVWLVETLEPGLLPALVNTPEMDPELRLAAAHRALRHGVLEGPELAGIYGETGRLRPKISPARWTHPRASMTTGCWPISILQRLPGLMRSDARKRCLKPGTGHVKPVDSMWSP